MASAQTQTHLCPPKTDGGVKKARHTYVTGHTTACAPNEGYGGRYNRKLLLKATPRYDSLRLGSLGNRGKVIYSFTEKI